MNEPKDVREMRQRINVAARGHERVDGKDGGPFSASPAAPMVRNVLTMAEAQGLSGEDAMTVLAYYALKEYERLYDLLLDDAIMRPTTTMVFAAPKAG